ncbi:9300_t:CDS:2 [Racocetra persica]|uniref:9300_t:CDS:1 n=1 Tax=Racocetra persica TaxID=160502 RepID=A0ACA9KEZ9_9GLOM|nr:9300_t:CDS:2 [Racocetra persica]
MKKIVSSSTTPIAPTISSTISNISTISSTTTNASVAQNIPNVSVIPLCLLQTLLIIYDIH